MHTHENMKLIRIYIYYLEYIIIYIASYIYIYTHDTYKHIYIYTCTYRICVYSSVHIRTVIVICIYTCTIPLVSTRTPCTH